MYIYSFKHYFVDLNLIFGSGYLGKNNYWNTHFLQLFTRN